MSAVLSLLGTACEAGPNWNSSRRFPRSVDGFGRPGLTLIYRLLDVPLGRAISPASVVFRKYLERTRRP